MLEHTDNILSRAVWANSYMYMVMHGFYCRKLNYLRLFRVDLSVSLFQFSCQ